ncbi:hypothetical protein HHK36_012705 [Tetracentron sinense]|uniref:DOC domain-containing protein n=1 Tax=Tetracentron sinense TaxID=13715 RepID=A0A834Z699_TETSI|nr:hypothetical protein HHK36_012705 [Tetracentron sinense]
MTGCEPLLQKKTRMVQVLQGGGRDELLKLVSLYVDFKLDENYTPNNISIWAGDGFHNLKLRLPGSFGPRQ